MTDYETEGCSAELYPATRIDQASYCDNVATRMIDGFPWCDEHQPIEEIEPGPFTEEDSPAWSEQELPDEVGFCGTSHKMGDIGKPAVFTAAEMARAWDEGYRAANVADYGSTAERWPLPDDRKNPYADLAR